MKLSLLCLLPFAAELARARPAPDDLLAFDGGDIAQVQAPECTNAEAVGNILNGYCSVELKPGRVLYKPVSCPFGKCSIPAPRCDTPAGIGMGWCMDATSTCSPTSFNNGLPGRPGKIVSSWCFEDGIPCCDGVVTNVVSLGLPSQFINSLQPNYDQLLSNNPNSDAFHDFSEEPPLQFSLLGTSDDDLFASGDGGGYQDDLVAANGGDASWFQS